ncbi:MAG TPA: glycosyltransferase [Puia sp.]
MNIIHVVEPFASGIATFLRSLVENLHEDLHIIIHGERETVMRSAEVKRSFPKANTQFIRWPSAQRKISFRKDIVAFWELYTILRRLKQNSHIDAVHLHSSKSGFLGRVACWLARIPKVIYTPNGAPFLSAASRWKNYIYGQLEKLGSFFGGTTVCCSASEWEVYQDLGIQADCIPNGVRVENSAGLAVRTPSPTAGKFRIVTTGRIVYQKDPALFNTIASWFEDFDQFEFVWVGDGEDKHELTAKNIIVTGWLPPDDIHDYLVGAHLYLSTSHFEGLPFSVLEALALKKPVLLNDCIGNSDLVHGGLNGDLFQDGEDAVLKIMRYYNNRNMLAVMGEYSRQICVEEFNVDTTFNSYRHLYKN